MKKLIIALIALLPLTVSSAVTQWRATWAPQPADETVTVECLTNGAYATVGQAAGNGSVVFSRDETPGYAGSCRAWTSKAGIADSARSEVALYLAPLAAPTGLRIDPVVQP